jgi:hypothetical protein
MRSLGVLVDRERRRRAPQRVVAAVAAAERDPAEVVADIQVVEAVTTAKQKQYKIFRFLPSGPDKHLPASPGRLFSET